ncbi:hypothetical protein D3C81_429500 [compost metagenome]
MNNDRVNPADREKRRDAERADETLPASSPSDDEPEADELTLKIDEIERKVADGN